MALWSQLKMYYLKENFDFDRSDIDLHIFHPQLRIFLSLNGIFFNNRKSKIRFISPVLNILMVLVGIGLELMFIKHGLEFEDYSFASECFCYLMILGTVPVVYVSVLYNRDKIVSLIDEMNADFQYINKLGDEYRKPFLKGQLLIWKMCGLWMGFCTVTASLYIGNTGVLLLYQSLFAAQDEHMIRPLIFPMWLPHDDPYRTPNYEMFLLLEILICYIMVQTFGVYVYTLFHYLLHFYIMMDMIILDLNVIFEGLDEDVVDLPSTDPRRVEVQRVLKRRMGRIVRWHNAVFDSVKLVSSVYGPTLIYQVIFTAYGLCIIAFQIADHLEKGKLHFLFACIGIGVSVQLWIPCYLGTLIRNKGFEVGHACWNCGWHETSLGRMLRQDIILIVLRSQKPIDIQFTGLPNLNLETFSSSMSTSYTYFNMLRQSTKN